MLHAGALLWLRPLVAARSPVPVWAEMPIMQVAFIPARTVDSSVDSSSDPPVFIARAGTAVPREPLPSEPLPSETNLPVAAKRWREPTPPNAHRSTQTAVPVRSSLPQNMAEQHVDQSSGAPTRLSSTVASIEKSSGSIKNPVVNRSDDTSTVTEQRDEIGNWQQAFSRLLVQRKRYPAQVRRLRLQGKVMVDAAFSAQGAITALSISAGSGHDSLDEAALQLVREAADAARQLASPGKSLHRQIPVVYTLAGGKPASITVHTNDEPME